MVKLGTIMLLELFGRWFTTEANKKRVIRFLAAPSKNGIMHTKRHWTRSSTVPYIVLNMLVIIFARAKKDSQVRYG
jgi:hypothetical protein